MFDSSLEFCHEKRTFNQSKKIESLTNESASKMERKTDDAAY